LAALPTDRGVAFRASPIVQWPRRAFCALTFKLDYLDNEALPRAPSVVESALALLRRTGLLGLHKWLPYRRWFRTDLEPYARAALDDFASRQSPFWSSATLRALSREHASGTQNRLREMHAALTLDAVDRTLLRLPR
jgi:asparagine synthase (glutamine-hydrolysing)